LSENLKLVCCHMLNWQLYTKHSIKHIKTQGFVSGTKYTRLHHSLSACGAHHFILIADILFCSGNIHDQFKSCLKFDVFAPTGTKFNTNFAVRNLQLFVR